MTTRSNAARQEPPPDDDPRGDFPLGPALDFMRRLWALNHALEQVSSRMARALGITAQQRLIIRAIGKYPGMTPSQLASLLHLDPGTISAALARLEQRRLLQRRRDHRDGRRVTVVLTPRGRELDKPAPGTVESAVEQLIAIADDDALATTADTLALLTAELTSQASRRAARARPATGDRRNGARRNSVGRAPHLR